MKVYILDNDYVDGDPSNQCTRANSATFDGAFVVENIVIGLKWHCTHDDLANEVMVTNEANPLYQDSHPLQIVEIEVFC